MKDFIIVSLSKENLKQALEVLDKVFGHSEEDKKWYTRGFNASLGNKKYIEMYDGPRPNYLEYFLAVEKKTGKIIGTTGLYAYQKDWDENAFSTGWFGVDADYRGKGVGKMLLEFTIARAKKLGRKYLRLWTSDSSETEKARKIYEKMGFKVTKKEKEKGKSYTSIFMELKL